MQNIGKVFGRLTVINFEYNKNNHKYYNCKCECGNTKIISIGSLKRGASKSCGCLRKEATKKTGTNNKKHGLRYNRLYSIWNNMIKRCVSKNRKDYKYYGGKGISVCKEWQNIEGFYNWAILNGYKEGLTIERKYINDNYNPQNCCFIPFSE